MVQGLCRHARQALVQGLLVRRLCLQAFEQLGIDDEIDSVTKNTLRRCVTFLEAPGFKYRSVARQISPFCQGLRKELT